MMICRDKESQQQALINFPPATRYDVPVVEKGNAKVTTVVVQTVEISFKSMQNTPSDMPQVLNLLAMIRLL